MQAEPDLDRIDRKILSILQEDGRIANLKLAEAVALSPTAVLARVQRLTRDGFILGYEARLNPLKLGAGMLVFVEAPRSRSSPANRSTASARNSARWTSADSSSIPPSRTRSA